MILSITMNPSVDIAYQIKDFHLDSVNRVEETLLLPGGKGLNVTRVLSQLNEAVVASGFSGVNWVSLLKMNLIRLILNIHSTKLLATQETVLRSSMMDIKLRFWSKDL